MENDSLLPDGSRLLAQNAFDFVLESELRRAMRAQNYLTLVVLETRREWEGLTLSADAGVVSEVADIVSREVRGTDPLGYTDTGTLSLLLLDADFDHSTRVVDRVMARVDHYDFPTPLRIAVGAACYPSHAVDAESLKRQAVARPVVNWRGGPGDRQERS
jgi:hypothetical protein